MMTLINSIVLFLLVTPFYAVFTDYKTGKIKNYFIFPFLLFSIILSFWIKGFYFDKTNIIGLLVIIFFGFLFYKDNKWGAGDGKYIILIGLNSLIISFLLGLDGNIINFLFMFIFGYLLIYTLFFLIINIKKIIKIKFINTFKFEYIDSFYLISFIYMLASILGIYIGTEYVYMIVFLSVILLLPYLNIIKNKYIKLAVIFSGIILSIITFNILNLFLIGLIFFFFVILQGYSEQIFNIIDIKKIKLYNILQGTILTGESINKIKNDTDLEFSESPLQGYDVYQLIGKYKENNNNPTITIYKDIRIGIIMYIGYITTFFYFM